MASHSTLHTQKWDYLKETQCDFFPYQTQSPAQHSFSHTGPLKAECCLALCVVHMNLNLSPQERQPLELDWHILSMWEQYTSQATV